MATMVQPRTGSTHWAISRIGEGGKKEPLSYGDPTEDGCETTEWPVSEFDPGEVLARWGEGQYQVKWIAIAADNSRQWKGLSTVFMVRHPRIETPSVPVAPASPAGALTGEPSGFPNGMMYMFQLFAQMNQQAQQSADARVSAHTAQLKADADAAIVRMRAETEAALQRERQAAELLLERERNAHQQRMAEEASRAEARAKEHREYLLALAQATKREQKEQPTVSAREIIDGLKDTVLDAVDDMIAERSPRDEGPSNTKQVIDAVKELAPTVMPALMGAMNSGSAAAPKTS